jgi:MFS family permease
VPEGHGNKWRRASEPFYECGQRCEPRQPNEACCSDLLGPNMKRRVSVCLRVLSCSKGLQIFGTSVMVTFSGLVGAQLAPMNSLATLPMTVMLVSMGVSTVPASFSIARLGARYAFGWGGILGSVGAALAALGTWRGSFVAFCVGSALLGTYQALAQYYRYAAADIVEPEEKGRAVSIVLAGGVMGAIAGPYISLGSQEWMVSTLFTGPFLALALLLLINSLVLFKLNGLATVSRPSTHNEGRPISLLLCDPTFLRAASMAAGAYAVMSYVMTAAPLAIVACGHGSAMAASGIQWHLVAMFAPSFATAFLQQRFGLRFLASVGCVGLLGSLALFVTSTSILNFVAGLVLLGVGWNFVYFSGTMLVVSAMPPEDQVRAQAATELAVMSSAAVVSGLAGVVFAEAGWMYVLFSALGMLALLAVIASTAIKGNLLKKA